MKKKHISCENRTVSISTKTIIYRIKVKYIFKHKNHFVQCIDNVVFGAGVEGAIFIYP